MTPHSARSLSLLVIGIGLFLFGQSPSTAEDLQRFTKTSKLMGTGCLVIAYAPDQATFDKAYSAAIKKAQDLQAVATDYDPDSELRQLESAPIGQAQKPSLTLAPLLEKAFALKTKTQGAFDPTIGLMSREWRRMRHTRKLSSPPVTTHGGVTWSHRRFTRTKEKIGLDLGGIGKGYAADLIHDHFVSSGISRVLILIGGETRLGLAPPHKAGWIIQLRTGEPKAPALTLHSCAVSTSGDLHQSITIDGKTYSHILDPKTGIGLTSPISATVIAPTCTLSDAIATAACVSPNQTLKQITAWGGTSVRIVTDKVATSKYFPRSIKRSP